MHSKGFGFVLQIRSLHFTPPDSGRALLELGVRPASAAACISEYLGSPVFSTGRGEQEQSSRARRRGIMVVLALGKVLFLINCAKPVFVPLLM